MVTSCAHIQMLLYLVSLSSTIVSMISSFLLPMTARAMALIIRVYPECVCLFFITTFAFHCTGFYSAIRTSCLCFICIFISNQRE